MLIVENPSVAHIFLGRLNDNAGTFRMLFAPSTCNMPLLDWTDSKTNLVPSEKQLREMDTFS